MAFALLILGYVLAAAAFYLVAARGAVREAPGLTLIHCGPAEADRGEQDEVQDLRAA